MEFIVIAYPVVRDVYMDGQVIGKTADTLRVEQGHHSFDLGEPYNYLPGSIEKDIQDTTSINPLCIDGFRPL